MIVPHQHTEQGLQILHTQEHSRHAAVIGTVTDTEPGRVVMRTAFGTQTYLPQPGNELLPRIC